MPYGQVIIGPPGSGKTTYCNALKLFFDAIGRPSIIVNLDPANENMPYTPDIDIEELITLEDVMEEFDLGPNGGLVYCMEFLQTNIDWLVEKLNEKQNNYIIIDCPGQVELYSHSDCIKNIMNTLENHGYRFTCLYLLDSYYISSPSLFISASLLALSTMVNMEMPAINVLSKIDMVEKFGEPVFDLDFYTSLPSLRYLLPYLNHEKGEMTLEQKHTMMDTLKETQQYYGDDTNMYDYDDSEEDEYYNDLNVSEEEKKTFAYKYRKLNYYLCDLFDSYGFVNYTTLNSTDAESISRVVEQADKANGFSFLSYISNDPKNTLSKDGNIKNVIAKNDAYSSDYIDELNSKYLSRYKDDSSDGAQEECKESDEENNGFV